MPSPSSSEWRTGPDGQVFPFIARADTKEFHFPVAIKVGAGDPAL